MFVEMLNMFVLYLICLFTYMCRVNCLSANCSLQLTTKSMKNDLDVLLSSSAKVIEYDITIENVDLEQKRGRFYRWNHWVRTVDNRGKSLLMLEEHYELLSLNTMKIGVERLPLMLVSEPKDCVKLLSVEDTVILLRRTLLSDFTNPLNESSGPKYLNIEICHMYTDDKDGKAVFLYLCCHYNDMGQMVCLDIVKDGWMNVLFVLVIFVKVLLILFSPLLIPGELYRKKYTKAEYHYHIQDHQTPNKSIRIVTTSSSSRYIKNNNDAIKLSKLTNLSHFNIVLSSLKLDRVYEMELNDFQLSVTSRKLLAKNVEPISLCGYFYEKICGCKLRRIDAFRECCESNLFGNKRLNCQIDTWYKCLKPFMKLIQILTLIIPWIVRISIYIMFEQEVENRKWEKAEQLQLSLNFTGSLTLFLAPLHALFILVYTILAVDALVYGLMSNSVKNKLTSVAINSLRDMREKSKYVYCNKGIKIALKPCRRFGLLGLILVIPYWITLLLPGVLMFILYFLASPNLLLRMLINLCKFKIEEEGEHLSIFARKKIRGQQIVVFQYFVIFFCVISFLSAALLVLECLLFVVELTAYTIIGIIIHAEKVQKLSVLILFSMYYFYDCLRRLYTLYLNYHQIIVQRLLEREKIQMQDAYRCGQQENSVFRVKTESTLPDIMLMVKDNELKWKTSGFLVFVDIHACPRVPEKFIMESVEMKYHACPGPIYKNIWRTFLNFSVIVLFLIFILITVNAFSDIYSISSTYKGILTLAVGFLPSAYRYFSTEDDKEIDVNNLQFQTEFLGTISNYEQHWPVFDIKPVNITEIREIPASMEPVEEPVDLVVDVTETLSLQNQSWSGSATMINKTDLIDGEVRIEVESFV